MKYSKEKKIGLEDLTHYDFKREFKVIRHDGYIVEFDNGKYMHLPDEHFDFFTCLVKLATVHKTPELSIYKLLKNHLDVVKLYGGEIKTKTDLVPKE